MNAQIDAGRARHATVCDYLCSKSCCYSHSMSVQASLKALSAGRPCGENFAALGLRTQLGGGKKASKGESLRPGRRDARGLLPSRLALSRAGGRGGGLWAARRFGGVTVRCRERRRGLSVFTLLSESIAVKVSYLNPHEREHTSTSNVAVRVAPEHALRSAPAA